MKETINTLQNEIIKRQEAIQAMELTKKVNIDMVNDLQKEIDAIKIDNLKKILKDLPEDVTITHHDGRFEFNKEGIDRSLSGMFTLYSRKRYEGSFEKAINYYTGSCEDESQMERLILLGQLAGSVKDISAEDLFKATSEGTKDLQEQINALSKKRWEAERVVGDFKFEISNLKNDILELQLSSEEGIKIDKEDATSLTVGNDKIYSFETIGVRIKSKSTSGKTATVVVTSLHTSYDSETDKYISKSFERTFERVKIYQLLFGVRILLKRVEEKKQQRELANTAS